jgi:hypothetical protein
MLCRNWMHWRDPDDDDTAELLDCLGFAPPLCDVHAEEDNWVEMKRLLGFFPQGTIGYVIPVNSAGRNDEGLLDCLVTSHPPGKGPGNDRGELHPSSLPSREEGKKDVSGFLRHARHFRCADLSKRQPTRYITRTMIGNAPDILWSKFL